MKMLLPISRTLGMSIESLVKRCARLDDVFLAGRNKLRRKENIGAVFGCTASLVVTPWDSGKPNATAVFNPSKEEGEEANSSSKTADMPD